MQTLSLSQLINFLAENTYFFVDCKVADLHLSKALRNKIVWYVDNPEENKNLESFEKASLFFIKHKMTRQDKLICIGGGATTDLGGFVASCLYRGVNWISIPTTVLAAVDASIGGKVGVNTIYGKNLIGNFHQPEKEIFVEELLRTLPKKEVQSGKGEILKYLLLHPELKKNLNDWQQLVLNCAQYKKEIVSQDFNEKGKRAILNYGHTFGHAIEKETGLEHGIAVASGIKINIELFSPELKDKFLAYSEQLELDLPRLKVRKENFLEYLQHDKKNPQQGIVRFIIIKNKVKVIDLSLDHLKETLNKYESGSYYIF